MLLLLFLLFTSCGFGFQYQGSLQDLRVDLLEQKLARLATEEKGLLVCMFVIEQAYGDPLPVDLTIHMPRSDDLMIPIHPRDEAHQEIMTQLSWKAKRILTYLSAIPISAGTYDLEVAGPWRRVYEHSTILPGRVTILTHLADLDDMIEEKPGLIQYYRDQVQRYLGKYDGFIDRIRGMRERTGQMQLVIDLDLNFNQQTVTPVTRVVLDQAILRNQHLSSHFFISNPRLGGIEYQGTSAIPGHITEITHSYYRLFYQLHFPPGQSKSCFNLELQGFTLRQTTLDQKRVPFNTDGIIEKEGVVCFDQSENHSVKELHLTAMRKRDGLWRLEKTPEIQRGNNYRYDSPFNW